MGPAFFLGGGGDVKTFSTVLVLGLNLIALVAVESTCTSWFRVDSPISPTNDHVNLGNIAIFLREFSRDFEGIPAFFPLPLHSTDQSRFNRRRSRKLSMFVRYFE